MHEVSVCHKLKDRQKLGAISAKYLMRDFSTCTMSGTILDYLLNDVIVSKKKFVVMR